MPLYLNKVLNILIIVACTSLPIPSHAATTNDLRLMGLDGKQHKLSEFLGKGKWTLVNIWGPDCPPCKEEIPELVLYHEDHKNRDAQVLGIAIDFPSFGYAEKKAVDKFVDDHLVDFPVLLSDAGISRKLGAGELEGLPTTLMFSPDGRLVAKQVGAITREIIENFINGYEARNKKSMGGKTDD
jgi:thiol-disulfide isomerase/thioredoxin